jgi:hypothetical protein
VGGCWQGVLHLGRGGCNGATEARVPEARGPATPALRVGSQRISAQQLDTMALRAPASSGVSRPACSSSRRLAVSCRAQAEQVGSSIRGAGVRMQAQELQTRLG